MTSKNLSHARRKAAIAAMTAGLLFAGSVFGASAAAADDGPPEPGQSEFRGPNNGPPEPGQNEFRGPGQNNGPIEPGQNEFRGLGGKPPKKRKGKPSPGIGFWGS